MGLAVCSGADAPDTRGPRVDPGGKGEAVSWLVSGLVKHMETGPTDGKRFKRSEKSVLLVLAEAFNDEQRAAWLSVPEIGRRVILGERRVRIVLRRLKERELLDWTARTRENGSTTSNWYTMPWVTDELRAALKQGKTPAKSAGGQ